MSCEQGFVSNEWKHEEFLMVIGMSLYFIVCVLWYDSFVFFSSMKIACYHVPNANVESLYLLSGYMMTSDHYIFVAYNVPQTRLLSVHVYMKRGLRQ